jgi:di/tricarboxylate transporter
VCDGKSAVGESRHRTPGASIGQPTWSLGKDAPIPPVAFSGFANDTAWFLFGALLIGVIATRSGVARRLAYTIMLRVGITYPRILLGLIVTDFLLTFVVPSGIARVVIMAAIALGLVEAFGAARGSNVARGMFLILTYTANIFEKMIIAGAGSITARGILQSSASTTLADVERNGIPESVFQ